MSILLITLCLNPIRKNVQYFGLSMIMTDYMEIFMCKEESKRLGWKFELCLYLASLSFL